jgi:hypothetical protein
VLERNSSVPGNKTALAANDKVGLQTPSIAFGLGPCNWFDQSPAADLQR